MRPNIQWTVQLAVKEGQLENAHALAAEMTDATHEEAGSVQYELFFRHDGRVCHILEEYRDSDAAMAHMQTFLTQFVERFLGCFDPTGIFVYGAPNDELQEVMKAFGPTYLKFNFGFVK